MAAKRVDPLKAKEAKQKKIAAIGGVLLLALLGVQGPKTLKMLKGPQAVASPTSTAPAPTPGVTTTPTPGSGVAAPVAATGGGDVSSLANSDAAPIAEQGQLATFERFASKDPFVQQAEPVPPQGTVSTPSEGAKEEAPNGAGTEKPKDGESSAGTGGFTKGGSATPAGPAAPTIAAATSISVNGAAEDVAVEASFPTNEPTFVLVSIAKNGKSVEIGIAGGEYASGGKTMTLALGKKITLQNTADGSRYELELLAVQGQPLPKPKN